LLHFWTYSSADVVKEWNVFDLFLSIDERVESCPSVSFDRTDHSHWITSVNERFIYRVCSMILLSKNLIFIFILGAQIVIYTYILSAWVDHLCGLLVRVLGYRSGGPGSIPGTTKKKQ
jgi:hypothetical protein